MLAFSPTLILAFFCRFPDCSTKGEDEERVSLAVLCAEQQPRLSRAVGPVLGLAYVFVFFGQVIPSFSMVYSGPCVFAVCAPVVFVDCWHTRRDRQVPHQS